MKDVSVGSNVMVSLEFYLKSNGEFTVPPFGKVIDVNGRIVTVEDNYGHAWNIDKIFLEDDYIEDSFIEKNDSFNDKIVKNFIQLFQNEENLDHIDSKVDKYFTTKLNPFDNQLGKVLMLLRAVEKYSVFEDFNEEVEAKIEYLYELIESYKNANEEENGQQLPGKIDLGNIRRSSLGNMQQDKENSPINPMDYLTDMTKHAAEEPYDKAYGREKEIREVMRYVKHRDKKNAILVGKQGCGKTTIIEELANRIANHEIPALDGKRILAMDVDGMIAGTKYRGMFEERCKSVLQYCATQKDVIVFIDEVHKIMGAGGNTEGGMNLGNLMKTYLTKGISVIGATTYDEYNNLKDDAALARRFGIVTIDEQEPEVVKWILGQVKENYEDFHGVEVTDTLLSAIVDTFDQKNYNTAGIDYAKNALDSICTIMEMDNVSQAEAYAEFMDGQNYDKEENNSYVKKGKLGFGTSSSDNKVTGEKKIVRSPEVQAYIDQLEEEESNLWIETVKEEVLGLPLKDDYVSEEDLVEENEEQEL